MDLEETKKIIRNKITADEAAREVRSHIKSYIDKKQNLREGFTETFKPLIETSEAVKTSIDTQQNKLIKQLQDNQLALTDGLDKKRLAITSDFDKMDEVKKWDLSQLLGYEATLDAIEEPEKEDKAEDINEKIKIMDARIDENIDTSYEFIDLLKKSEDLLKVYHDLLSNKAKFDIIGGVSKAFARNKNPPTDKLLQISYYNVLGKYVNNINKLENIAKKNRTRYHPLQQPSTTC